MSEQRPLSVWTVTYTLWVKSPRGQGESQVNHLTAAVIAEDLVTMHNKLEKHCRETNEGFSRIDVTNVSKYVQQAVIY